MSTLGAANLAKRDDFIRAPLRNTFRRSCGNGHTAIWHGSRSGDRRMPDMRDVPDMQAGWFVRGDRSMAAWEVPSVASLPAGLSLAGSVWSIGAKPVARSGCV